MNIETFSRLSGLVDAGEIDKVALLAFYFLETKDQQEFSIGEMAEILAALGCARPNQTRLASRLRKSRDFIKGSRGGLFRLHASRRSALKATYPELTTSEAIASDSSLIPEILFDGLKRLYLSRTVQQINASYEANLFDACALMMRRLLEILLIHTLQKAGLEAEVVDADGMFNPLKTLINKASSRSEVGLSAPTRKSIDQFRELGNLSAHLIHYSCRRDDIRAIRMEYRAVIEELLYKAGLKS